MWLCPWQLPLVLPLAVVKALLRLLLVVWCSSNLLIVPWECCVCLLQLLPSESANSQQKPGGKNIKKHIRVTVMKCSLKNWARVRMRNEKKHYQTSCCQSFCFKLQTVLHFRHCALRSYVSLFSLLKNLGYNLLHASKLAVQLEKGILKLKLSSLWFQKLQM